MDNLEYDCNFMIYSGFKTKKIKEMLLSFLNYNLKMKATIIKNMTYNDFTFDIYIGKEKSVNETVFINLENIDSIFNENIITNIYLDFGKNYKLHIFIGYFEERNTCIPHIGLFYDIGNLNLNFQDTLFLYLGNTFFKLIDILSPDIVNMGETTIPISINSFKKGNVEGEFVYLDNKHIKQKSELLQKYKIHNKLENGYLLYVK